MVVIGGVLFRLRQQIFVFSRTKMTAMCESAARCLESPANFRTRPARRSLMGTLTGKDTVAWFALKSEYKGIIRKICGSTEANYPCSCMRCLLPKSKTIHVRHTGTLKSMRQLRHAYRAGNRRGCDSKPIRILLSLLCPSQHPAGTTHMFTRRNAPICQNVVAQHFPVSDRPPARRMG